VGVEGFVLVHGGMCTAACWDPVVTHLAMRVVAVDLPGRGSRPADLFRVTLDDCVQAVIDSAKTSTANPRHMSPTSLVLQIGIRRTRRYHRKVW
jgi:pimeloyl-ACP methyl ester carboxylesterase